MTDSKPSIAHGDDYLVIYSGGPYDGQTDRRISTDGSWDDEVTVLTAVDGKETLESYDATTWHEVDGSYQVTYLYNAGDSEKAEDPEDRGDRQ